MSFHVLIFIFALEKCLLKIFCTSKNGSFMFLLFCQKSSLHILDIHYLKIDELLYVQYLGIQVREKLEAIYMSFALLFFFFFQSFKTGSHVTQADFELTMLRLAFNSWSSCHHFPNATIVSLSGVLYGILFIHSCNGPPSSF